MPPKSVGDKKLRARIEPGFAIVEICMMNLLENTRTFLKEDDHTDLFDILIGEGPPLFPFESGILTHHQVRGVAGNPLRREECGAL